VVAAETLRRHDSQATIRLFCGEQEPVYSRMAIPYLLSRKIDERGTWLREPGHFDSLSVELVHQRIESVDPAAHRVLRADGGGEPYDRLLIATGARAVSPPVPGLDQSGVHSCWTLADARAIAARARPGSRVVLMGAGFIGCIILEALVLRGVHLTVIEAEDRMVPRMMDATGGAMLRAWCEAKGVAIHTGARVRAVESTGSDALAVHCEHGAVFPADLLVVATGVTPNLGLVEGDGRSVLETGRGIRVDETQRTSAPDVYAAGDVCEAADWYTGEGSVYAIQPAAAEQGRIAALNMCGRVARYSGALPMNVLDTLGLVTVSFGHWEGVEGGESVREADPERHRYLRLEFDGRGRLVGAIAVGLPGHVGVLRGLIQSGTPLGPWKARLMAAPGRIAEAYVARVAGAARSSGPP
jgi:NAD(P)H-nitrite reductase large subunit